MFITDFTAHVRLYDLAFLYFLLLSVLNCSCHGRSSENLEARQTDENLTMKGPARCGRPLLNIHFDFLSLFFCIFLPFLLFYFAFPPSPSPLLHFISSFAYVLNKAITADK